MNIYELCIKYPDKSWNWYQLFKILDPDYVFKNKDILYQKYEDIIPELNEILSQHNELYNYPLFCIDSMIKESKNKYCEKFKILLTECFSFSKNFNFIKNHPDYPWFYIHVIDNIKIDYKYEDLENVYDWEWENISKNIKLSKEILMKYKDKLSWILVAQNKSLTYDLIKYIKKNWWDDGINNMRFINVLKLLYPNMIDPICGNIIKKISYELYNYIFNNFLGPHTYNEYILSINKKLWYMLWWKEVFKNTNFKYMKKIIKKYYKEIPILEGRTDRDPPWCHMFYLNRKFPKQLVEYIIDNRYFTNYISINNIVLLTDIDIVKKYKNYFIFNDFILCNGNNIWNIYPEFLIDINSDMQTSARSYYINYMCLHIIITQKFLDTFFNDINWHNISMNPYLNSDIIINNINHPWDWKIIWSNIYITNDLLEKAYDKIIWDSLSYNKSLSIDIIDEYKNYLNWKILSRNIYINNEFIEKFHNYINWYEISFNKSLSYDIVNKYINYPWKFQYLHYNDSHIYFSTIKIQSYIRMINLKHKLFLKEIEIMGSNYYYRPGKGGYEESKKEFEKYI